MSSAPTTVGRFDLLAPLQAGGMARIDLARLRGPYDFVRHVVVKRPLPHQARDPDALAQFRVEARLLAAIHHPNVVGFVEAGRDPDGVDFMALEYVHGLSLGELLRARRPAGLPLEIALTILTEVAAGLAEIHGLTDASGALLGVVHRDVSPSNVMLGYDGSVKLIDLGVAKLTAGATASNALRGKVTYMAPEQCKGEPVGARTDLYAVGVMLYELATGQRPFAADDDVAILHKVIQGTFAQPREVAPSIDDSLAAIITRAMAYDPADRFASARELRDALDDYARARGFVLDPQRLGELLGTPRLEPWRVAPATEVATLSPATPVVTERSRVRRAPWIASAVIAAGAVAAYAVSQRGASEPATASPLPAPTRSTTITTATPTATTTPTTPTTLATPTTPTPPGSTTSALADAPVAPATPPARVRPGRPTRRSPLKTEPPPTTTPADTPPTTTTTPAPAPTPVTGTPTWRPDMLLPPKKSPAP